MPPKKDVAVFLPAPLFRRLEKLQEPLYDLMEPVASSPPGLEAHTWTSSQNAR